MIIVTGSDGFIGGHTMRALRSAGHEVLAVDVNDAGFNPPIARITEAVRSASAFIHLGANSNTMESDEKKQRFLNYWASAEFLRLCDGAGVKFIYASSGAVYGAGSAEGPLNLYGELKLQFDRHVDALRPILSCRPVGLRFFNVYGTGESHKGAQASAASKAIESVKENRAIPLFQEPPEIRRDFVYVGDVVAVILWMIEHAEAQGIFDVGTGEARPYADAVEEVVRQMGRGRIERVPFPAQLVGRYQYFTRADLRALRGAGCQVRFRTLEEGVRDILQVCKNVATEIKSN